MTFAINTLKKRLKEEYDTKTLFESVLILDKYTNDIHAKRQAEGSLPSCIKRIEELINAIDILSKN